MEPGTPRAEFLVLPYICSVFLQAIRHFSISYSSKILSTDNSNNENGREFISVQPDNYKNHLLVSCYCKRQLSGLQIGIGKTLFTALRSPVLIELNLSVNLKFCPGSDL